jgi:hypothetical protein
VSYGEIFLMVLSFFFSMVAIVNAAESTKIPSSDIRLVFWTLVACALFSFGLDLAGV